MWLVKENENQLIIRAIPTVLWSLAAGAFVGQIFIVNFYLQAFKETSNFGNSLSDILTNLFALSFFFICGLGLLAFAPLISAKIDRRTKTLTIEKFGLFGKRIRPFRFDMLKGGFRVESETDDDGKENYSLYFELNSGEKIELCSESTSRAGRAFDVAMRANEYLREARNNSTL
jgi:hypothetical protein